MKKHFDWRAFARRCRLIRCCLLRARPRLNRYRRGANALTLAIDKTAALLVVHKGPSNKATLLLPPGHLFLTTFTAPTSVRARYNGGKFSPRDTSEVNHITCFAKPLLSSIIFLIKVTSPPSHHNSCCWPPKFSASSLFSPRLRRLHSLPARAAAAESWNGGLHKVASYCSFLWMMPLKIAPLSFADADEWRD